MNQRPFLPINEFSIEKQLDFPVAYDFLPLLSFQQKYHGDAECYWVRAHSSKSVDEVTYGSRETVVSPGGAVEQDPIDGQKTVAHQGHWHPFDRSETHFDSYPLELLAGELFRPVRVSELVVTGLGMKYEIPDKLQSKPIFDGASEIAHEMTNRGNRSKQLHRQLGIETFSPYQDQKNHLQEQDTFDDDVVPKALRGHLVSHGLYTDTGVSHYAMAAHGVLKEVLEEIHRSDFLFSNVNDFTRDIGEPEELRLGSGQGNVGRYYRLMDKEENMPG